MNVDDRRPHGQTLIAAERRRRILDRICTGGSVNVSDLARELNVGVTTIRQDLNALDEQGKLVRSHGGAIAKDGARPVPPYSQTRGQRMDDKSSIAIAALDLVPATGRFFIGPGTTALQFARQLPGGHDFRVATNSLEVALHLVTRGIATVDLIGGTICPETLSADIPACSSDLEDLCWDACFLGATAVDMVRGVTSFDKTEMQWKRKILEQSSRRVVLCDSSKIGTFAYVKVCPVSMISVLITDSGIDANAEAQLRETGVQVIVAPSA